MAMERYEVHGVKGLPAQHLRGHSWPSSLPRNYGLREGFLEALGYASSFSIWMSFPGWIGFAINSYLSPCC
jgi:hypothetical protein